MNFLKILFLTFIIVIYSCSEPTKPKPPNGQDTTSHNITWETYEFGYQGSSVLADVYILNDSSFWAVGRIHTEETDIYDSLGNYVHPYNALYWDGDSISFHRIGENDNEFHSIDKIYAFSKDDLWISSIPRYWNGSKWTEYHLWDMGILDQNDGGVPNIWGNNSSDMYFSGRKGTVVKYDGQNWQKMESGTELTLKDIYGFPDDSFYTVGYEELKGSVVVHYDGTNIKTKHYPDIYSNKLSSIWGASKNEIYMVGSGIFKFENDSLIAREYPESFPKYQMECVRGTAANNIFVAGHGGFVMHYNGKSWKYYPELLKWRVFKSISVVDGLVVIVGYGNGKAHLAIGRQENISN